MTLGPFSLLPLLEGWDYAVYWASEVVARGERRVVKEVADRGWLLSIGYYTNDAEAGCRVEFGGPAGLRRHTAEATPQDLYNVGATQQDPAGWLQLYERPSAASTAGSYFVALFSGGFQGSPLPFVPPVKVTLFLREESTQPAAAILFSAFAIVITDADAFRRSLQRILWPVERLEVGRAG